MVTVESPPVSPRWPRQSRWSPQGAIELRGLHELPPNLWVTVPPGVKGQEGGDVDMILRSATGTACFRTVQPAGQSFAHAEANESVIAALSKVIDLAR